MATLLSRLLTEDPQPNHHLMVPTLWDELMFEVEHQGTIYPATIAAFPFLVQAVARVAPGQRMYWLGWLAHHRLGRNLSDPEGQVTSDLSVAFEQAVQDVVPLALETMLLKPGGEASEREVAGLLALLAFARGEARLGFVLADWWPYGTHPIIHTPIPVAALAEYEASTGDVRNPDV